MKLEPWAMEEARNHTGSRTTVHILLVIDQRLPVRGSRPKVVEVAPADITHPTELFACRPWESKGLGQPFPIAPYLQHSEARQLSVPCQPVLDFVCMERSAIMAGSWRFAFREATETPSNHIEHLLVGVKPTAAFAELPLGHNEQNMSPIPDGKVDGRDEVHRADRDRSLRASPVAAGVCDTVSMDACHPDSGQITLESHIGVCCPLSQLLPQASIRVQPARVHGPLLMATGTRHR